MLHGAASLESLGRCFGADLYEREVAYLVAHEWARSAEDVLWRRSKLGLPLSAGKAEALEAWLAARHGHHAGAQHSAGGHRAGRGSGC